MLPDLLLTAYRSISLAWDEKFPHARIPSLRAMAEMAEARTAQAADAPCSSAAAAAGGHAEVPGSNGTAQREAPATAGAPGASSGTPGKVLPGQDVLMPVMGAAAAAGEPYQQQQQARRGLDDDSRSFPGQSSGEGAEQAAPEEPLQPPVLAAGSSRKRSAEDEAPDQDRRKRHGAAAAAAGGPPALRAGSIGSMVNSLEQQVGSAHTPSCTSPFSNPTDVCLCCLVHPLIPFPGAPGGQQPGAGAEHS